MDFTLSEEQKQIQDKAYRFAVEKLAPLSRQYDREEKFCRDVVKMACEEGLVGCFIPKEYGGAGYGFFEHCLVTEEFCAVDPGIGRAILSTTHGAEIISSFGLNHQKKQIFPELISGKSILAVAVSEPDGDWNVMRAATTATKDEDMWVINGSKTFVLNLNSASVEFAEDLPAAGRCKTARAQTYDDTSSPCQRRPASRRDKISAPGG